METFCILWFLFDRRDGSSCLEEHLDRFYHWLKGGADKALDGVNMSTHGFTHACVKPCVKPEQAYSVIGYYAVIRHFWRKKPRKQRYCCFRGFIYRASPEHGCSRVWHPHPTL